MINFPKSIIFPYYLGIKLRNNFKKYIYYFAIMGACITPSLSFADGEPTPFLGPQVWNSVPAGTYWLQAEGTNLCITRTSGTWIGQNTYFSTQTCGNLYGASLGIIPVSYRDNKVAFRITNSNQCASVARGVVFGPPAIDSLNCESANSDEQALGAANDQKFTFIRNSNGTVKIITKENKCIGVQGQNPQIGNHLIQEDCTSIPSQNFKMIEISDALNITDNQALRRFGWFRTQTGAFANAPNTFFRSMRGMNYPSGDYRWFATDNDSGAKCAIECTRDNSCKAYTWVNPAARNGVPMCYLKNALNTPVPDAMTMSGFVRY